MAPPTPNAAPQAGRFQHPWLTPLPPGRARVYDIMYKSVTTLLVAFSAYGFYEVSRGTYYVMHSNRMRKQQDAEQVTEASHGSGASSNIVTASTATVVAPYSSVTSVPWKVQWQLQSSVEVNLSLANSNNAGTKSGSGDTTQQQSQQQQPQNQQISWTPFNRADSVRLAALEASGWGQELFDARFADLTAVLPDLPRVLSSLLPAQLLAAMSDTHATAAKVILLKAALPSTNVGMLLLLHPPFLDPAYGAERLLAGVEHASRVLGGAAVAEEVIQWYPPLMDPTVLDASVAQLRRLVPHLARNCLPASGRGMGPYGGREGSGEAFAGDPPAISAARKELKNAFLVNRDLTDQRQINSKLAEALEANDFLRENVIQAVKKDCGSYGRYERM
ncbi:hypothetical protein VOLCADRAFT_121584 [Volvox carteri f. nagariensis]|uniref:Uncharacterized protein n=1 Tax=Volvox carteri f. nagariensis TaxID=3068 RepID=D8UE52_VOLCA|nr:uncharacterized protein VOLCADRAFT_121584 [Volvox carteri f. nagariensis]EFJ42067.1 hypothetical protein VOLCADRAFT_121584 [Volvox carteri f. nagariensis]|eukprot:XP_002956942.1 hypothetical protein VOLCADRAFT_121584 [Volvox carteri f. nagariensis]